MHGSLSFHLLPVRGKLVHCFTGQCPQKLIQLTKLLVAHCQRNSKWEGLLENTPPPGHGVGTNTNLAKVISFIPDSLDDYSSSVLVRFTKCLVMVSALSTITNHVLIVRISLKTDQFNHT